MKPWLTDQKYGGMSEIAAQRSYEAWVRQGRRVLEKAPIEPRPAAPDEEIERIKRSIHLQLDEYQAALNGAADWMKNWRTRPRGFRATQRKRA